MTSRSFPLAARYFLFGQAFFYLLLAVQIVLRPAGLTANHGICYYELYSNTMPLYLAGLIGAGLLHLQAVRLMPRQKPLSGTVFAYFKGMGLCLLGLILAPISLGKGAGLVHVFFGSSLFLIQLTLAIRLAAELPGVIIKGAAAIQFVTGVLCILSLLHILRLQIEAQVVFQVAFAAIMLQYLLS